jgi:hypothetical protein
MIPSDISFSSAQDKIKNPVPTSNGGVVTRDGESTSVVMLSSCTNIVEKRDEVVASKFSAQTHLRHTSFIGISNGPIRCSLVVTVFLIGTFVTNCPG